MTKTILLLNYGIESVYEPSIGDNEVNFLYGFNEERVRMTESYNTMERQKTYVANCEFITESESGLVTEKSWTFLTCLTGVFAVVEKQGDTATLHYILKDNLGSWSVVTDKHGNIEQELSFDAWGNLRNPETWRTWSGMPEPMFDRGFTGHEHLYAFGLINMNGRMYDPQMSSFLSVDAYVQSPENAQGFNRYAYCMNNPLRYTDPSGWRLCGPMPGNPFHDNWSRSFVEPVYEPRDLGIEQLTDYEAIWMRGEELHGGGGDNGHGGKGGWVEDKNGIHYDKNATTNTKGFLDITYSSGNTYYGLLGDTYDLNTEQGRFWKNVYDAMIQSVEDSRRINSDIWGWSESSISTVDFSDVTAWIPINGPLEYNRNIHVYENNNPRLTIHEAYGIFTPCDVSIPGNEKSMCVSFGGWSTAYPYYGRPYYSDEPVPIPMFSQFPPGYTLYFSHEGNARAYLHFLSKQAREYTKLQYARVFGYTYQPNRP